MVSNGWRIFWDDANNGMNKIENMFFLLISITFIYNFPAFITKPIKEITEKIQLISENNFEGQISNSKSGDFKDLINIFNNLTEKLKEKLLKQTSLKEETESGNLMFEGQITDYEVRPMAIQKEDMAAQNRLTVTVRLKYTNNKDHEADFDKSFSAYEDFSSSMSLNDVESSIVPQIVEKLIEDIFNATIANW